MSNYSLADLRAAVEQKYAPVEIDGYQLRNLLRLGDKERENVLAALSEVENTQDEDGGADALSALLTASENALALLVADDRGEEFVTLLGHDLALTLEVLSKWTEATQAGEAQPSQG